MEGLITKNSKSILEQASAVLIKIRFAFIVLK